MKTSIVWTAAAIGVGCLAIAAADKTQTTDKEPAPMNQTPSAIVSVRYMINDVDAAVAFYTKYLGFTLEQNSAPAFASVVRGNLRLLLSGEKSSGRQPLPDGTKPYPVVGIAFTCRCPTSKRRWHGLRRPE